MWLSISYAHSDQIYNYRTGMHGHPVGYSEMFILSSRIGNLRSMDRSQATGRHFPEKHMRSEKSTSNEDERKDHGVHAGSQMGPRQDPLYRRRPLKVTHVQHK